MREEKKASILGIIGNLFLFLIKIFVGVIYNSISIISDAINSFTDIIASFIIFYSIHVAKKKPDRSHQFGHNRAEPIAGLIVAIFIGIVGFQIIISGFNRVFSGERMVNGLLPLVVMIIVMIVKFVLYQYTVNVIKKTKNTALRASAIDHRNDVLIGLTVFIGIVFANFGYPILEPIIAIFIGVWIIKSGFEVGLENIKYLMGESPSKEFFNKIENEAMKVKGVIGLNDICAHYVGTKVEAEIHVYVDKKLNIQKAHAIGHKVQDQIEKLDNVSRAFIHIDPFLGKFYKKRKF